MKTAFFGNGPLACRVLNHLIEIGDPPALLIVHPSSRSSCREELLAVGQGCGAEILEADQIGTDTALHSIRSLAPDLGISVMFGYILRTNLLELFPRGCVNLHPALLPYNRGASPNVWPLIDGTPAGVTLHQIDEGIDTGPILAQREVPVSPEDTAKTLYERLLDESFDLFIQSWPALKAGSLVAQSQDAGAGTHHRLADFKSLDQIDLDAATTARQVINHLRARTFAPYPGAYFLSEDGAKIYLRVELSRDPESP